LPVDTRRDELTRLTDAVAAMMSRIDVQAGEIAGLWARLANVREEIERARRGYARRGSLTVDSQKSWIDLTTSKNCTRSTGFVT
jgi:ABC-type sugar transport system ATPase subunit